MNIQSPEKLKRSPFTIVQENRSFTPLSIAFSPSSTGLSLPPCSQSPRLKESPRVRPTAIIIPPSPNQRYYYLRELDMKAGSFEVSTDAEDGIEDEEMSKHAPSDCEQYCEEDESLIVLPTFYTPYKKESLVFSSRLNIPDIVIPESRIRTPRTPRTPMQNSNNPKRKVQSPSDVMFNNEKSPSEIVRGKHHRVFPTPKYQI